VTPSTINVDFASLDIKFADKVTNSYKLINGTLAVRDDFAGKIAGSVVENPNYCGTYNGAVLQSPSFGSWQEFSSGYAYLSTFDGTLVSATNTVNTASAQIRISKNVIRIVEDKYGPIPAIDKVQWLKDNILRIDFNWCGYGSGPLGNKATLSIFNPDTANWITGSTTSAGVVSKVSISINTLLSRIDSDGFVHFLVYANASDGVAPSTIYTDYCNIELTFKSLTGYDQLVPENPRRDAGMSAILFVRKETKEVQSLFPYTNEYLLATYSEYLEAPTPISANTDVTILAEIPEFLITDLGSAVGYKQGTHHWMNPAYRVGQDKLELYGELGFSSVPFAPDSIGVNVGAKISIASAGNAANFTRQHPLISISKPLVCINRWLVLINGELKILIYARYNASGNFYTFTSSDVTLILPLAGKPLVKESEGLVRNTILPTTWKTSPLVAQGFVDKATNKLITTNNSI